MNNCTDIFLNREPVVLEKLGEVAAKIAFYNFEWRYVTLVLFFATKYELALDSFLSNYNHSVIIKFGKFIPRNRFPIPQFVLFGEDTVEIIDIVKWLDKSQYDNAGKFIIICSSNDYNNCDEIQIFKTLCDLKIINVIYLRGDSDDGYLSFSYEIVLPTKCLNNMPDVIDIPYNRTDEKIFKTLYSVKLRNFYKCPLIISTFVQPPFMYLQNTTMEPSGGDGNIIKLIADALNATLIVKTPLEGNDWGHYENNNWTGSLGDVYNGRAHASVCSLPLTTNRYGNFQISFIYNSMDIVWTAQLPAQKPSWEKLMNPYNLELRVVLFLIFVCVILINASTKLKAWGKIRRVLKIAPPKSNLFFYSWAIFMAMPIMKMPSKRSLILIVYIWIWSCFVMRSAYQGALMSSLKRTIYEDYFPNFYKVFKDKLPYGGLGSLREYYADDKDIYDKWTMMDFDEAYEMLSKISNGTSDFVLAFNKEIIIEHLIQYNGLRQLQIIPEKILNSPTVMYFKKHSVLTAPVSHVLSLLVESGFTQFLHTRFLAHKKVLFERSINEQSEPLSLENFRGLIILIVLGWCLAILFFAVEVYCGRLIDYK